MPEPHAASGRTGRVSFDSGRVRSWAQLTRDDNPLHLDPDFAATTSFGVPITHGHLLACVAVDAAQRRDGVRLLEGGRVSVRFCAPVPVGADLRLDHREVARGREINGYCRDTEALQVKVRLATPTREDTDDK